MLERLRFLYRVNRLLIKGEAQELKFVRNFLKPGMIAFDIGVYKGVYSYWFAKSVGPDGISIGFEPQKKYYEYISRIMTKMGFRNYNIENTALSNFEGESTLSIPLDAKKGDSWATLEVSHDTNINKTTVKTTKLDTYCSNNDLLPDFIKCDVEGHELSVFQGATEILKKGKTVFLFECEEKHLEEDSPTTVFRFLEDYGYVGFYFDKQKGCLPLSYADENELSLVLANATRNFIFTPKEKSAQIRAIVGC